MKKYIYVDVATMEEKPIEANEVQVTTNGELLFLNLDRQTGVNNIMVAAVAPGFWVRFWEEGELIEIPQDGND